jgi:glycosyltransferase involved in cell wall biosynthesis
MEMMNVTNYSYELIFVDDGSTDNTRAIIDNIMENYSDYNIKKIHHDVNRGRGGTVMDGIKISEGNIVGFFDIDLEIGAHYILPCILSIINGNDISTVWRIYKFRITSIHRYFMSKGYSILVHMLLNVTAHDTEAGFKFFKRNKIIPVLDKIEDQRWFWDTEIMVRSELAGLKISEIPCLFLRQPEIKSTVSEIKDTVEYFIKLIKFKRKLKSEGYNKYNYHDKYK